MRRIRYARFVTEYGNTLEVDTTLEVVNQVTSEIIPAGDANGEEAVIIPPGWNGNARSILAIRDGGKRSA